MSTQILQNVWDHPAYSLAVSDDHKLLAVGSNRWVRVYALPAFQLLHKLPVRHIAGMTFSGSENALLMLSTTGCLFLWDGETTKKLGQKSGDFFSQNALWHWGDHGIALEHEGGICLVDPQLGIFRDFLVCPDCECLIASCTGDALHILTTDCGKRRQKPIWISVDAHGTVQQRTLVDCNLTAAARYSRPVMLDGAKIAFFVKTEKSLFQGRASLCVIDSNGQLTKSIVVPSKYARYIDLCSAIAVSRRYIALSLSVPAVVIIFDMETNSFALEISKNELRQELEINPPSSLLFLSERELLVGTWEKLFLYRIEPSSAPKVNGRIV